MTSEGIPGRFPSQRDSDMELLRFYLLLVWTHFWTNVQIAGDLRRLLGPRKKSAEFIKDVYRPQIQIYIPMKYV